MFDCSDVDDLEWAQTEANARHGLPKPVGHEAARGSAPPRRSADGAPCRRMRRAVGWLWPCRLSRPARPRCREPGVPVEPARRAQPDAASVLSVVQRWITTSTSFPSASYETSTSPVRRQGMRALPLCHSRASWLSSKVRKVVPSSSSRREPELDERVRPRLADRRPDVADVVLGGVDAAHLFPEVPLARLQLLAAAGEGGVPIVRIGGVLNPACRLGPASRGAGARRPGRRRRPGTSCRAGDPASELGRWPMPAQRRRSP